MFVLADTENSGAVIKVVGVGGGGGNAVTHMVSSGIEGVDFVCINTDAQALKHSKVKASLQIGSNITKGLGAGADPEVGRQAAMEDRDRIVELVEGSDMIFITAGMGGGTGTGAAPVVAQVAKELGILTVAVVTKPFEMEGNKRLALADQGIGELGKYVDSLITIPNQKLLTVLGGDTTLLDAFKSANQVLQGAVQGIAELITRPGLINVDFADVKTVMAETGMAMMGSGAATGENRARAAAEAAISSPLLEDVNLSGAHGLLINVTAGMDLRTSEFHVVGDTIKQYASEDATVVVGYVIDPEMTDQIRVTVDAPCVVRSTTTPTTTRRRTCGAVSVPSATTCVPTWVASRTSTSRRSCAARPTDVLRLAAGRTGGWRLPGAADGGGWTDDRLPSIRPLPEKSLWISDLRSTPPLWYPPRLT
jgi:cell division protein FtsZ